MEHRRIGLSLYGLSDEERRGESEDQAGNFSLTSYVALNVVSLLLGAV